MSSVNKVVLIGNCGKDPEARSFANGGKVVNLTLATSEDWKDKATGERKSRTEWHNVVIRNEKIGEVAERFVRKGSKIYVEGSIATRKYQGSDGQDRYITEIIVGPFRGELVLLDKRDAGEAPTERTTIAAPPAKPRPAARQQSALGSRSADDLDDSIPF